MLRGPRTIALLRDAGVSGNEAASGQGGGAFRQRWIFAGEWASAPIVIVTEALPESQLTAVRGFLESGKSMLLVLSPADRSARWAVWLAWLIERIRCFHGLRDVVPN